MYPFSYLLYIYESVAGRYDSLVQSFSFVVRGSKSKFKGQFFVMQDFVFELSFPVLASSESLISFSLPNSWV